MAISEALNELLKRYLGETAGGQVGAALDAWFLVKSGGTITGSTTITDAMNIILGTTTGTKIGTGVTQKLGFWNATPVIQPASAVQAAVTPSTSFAGSDTVDIAVVIAAVQAVETLVNRLRADLVTVGIIKGAA